MNQEYQTLINDLKRIGVTKGMVLMVHSSYKALQLRNTPPTMVIQALQEVLGVDGTLLMPALTYANVNINNPNFSYHNTPCCVGIIPEIFRKSKGVIRSLNPVHSVCSWGKYANEMTQNHFMDDISIGPNSPFTLLPSYNGKILMLGCGLKPNTFMHGVENQANAPYREIKYTLEYTMENADGTIYTYQGKMPSMSEYIQRYDRIESILSAPHLIKSPISSSTSYLIDSIALLEEGFKAIKKDPYFFVDRI